MNIEITYVNIFNRSSNKISICFVEITWTYPCYRKDGPCTTLYHNSFQDQVHYDLPVWNRWWRVNENYKNKIQ